MWETWRWDLSKISTKYLQESAVAKQRGGGSNKLRRFTVLSTIQSHEYTINPKPTEHLICIKSQNLRTKNPQKAPKDKSCCCSIHLWKPRLKGTGRPTLPSHNVTIHLCDTSVTLMNPWSSNCQTHLLTQNTLTKPLPTTPQRSSQTLEVKVRGWGYCSTTARVCFIDRNTPGRLTQT